MENDTASCGQGLAAHAGVPAAMAELLDALSKVLDTHVPTIDVSDPNGRLEHEAYVSLVNQYQQISRQLAAAAMEMTGYRDLPAASHDPEKLNDPALVDSFARFVSIEAKLLDALQRAAEEHHQMLGSMGESGDQP